MNKALRQGRGSELIVAGELIRHGLDVYVPCVDDQAIDLIVRLERPSGVHFYDIQVKSVAGYNRIIGVKSPEQKPGNYVLIIHYRHSGKPDEFFYLTTDQVVRHHVKNSPFGDLMFNKTERAEYARQTLADLPRALVEGDVAPVPGSYQIQHLALRHVVWKLGDAIRVTEPRWERGEWVVDLLSPGEEAIIGQLYFSRRGELLVSKSATYESVRSDSHVSRAEASAA